LRIAKTGDSGHGVNPVIWSIVGARPTAAPRNGGKDKDNEYVRN